MVFYDGKAVKLDIFPGVETNLGISRCSSVRPDSLQWDDFSHSCSRSNSCGDDDELSHATTSSSIAPRVTDPSVCSHLHYETEHDLTNLYDYVICQYPLNFDLQQVGCIILLILYCFGMLFYFLSLNRTCDIWPNGAVCTLSRISKTTHRTNSIPWSERSFLQPNSIDTRFSSVLLS